MVTQLVVDGLEPVQVEIEQSHRLTVALETGDGLLQSVIKQHPVRQAREVVVRRELTQAALGIFQVGDVASHGRHRLHAPQMVLVGKEQRRNGDGLAPTAPERQLASPDAVGGQCRFDDGVEQLA